mgnify:FL=1
MYSILHNLRKRYAASLPRLDNYQEIAMAGSFLNSEERLELIGFGEKKEFNPGRVASKDNNFIVDRSLRDANAITIRCNRKSEWIFRKLEIALDQCNKAVYKFKIVGFVEELQLIRYTPGGHYIWHKDFGNGKNSKRKLSMVIQLSDPEDYTGGELEFWFHGNNPFIAPKNPGALIFFPSFQLHRVMPVLTGVRYTLVGWVNGPPFR